MLPHRGQAAEIATSTVDSYDQFTAAALMKCDSNHYNINFDKVKFCVTISSQLEDQKNEFYAGRLRN